MQWLDLSTRRGARAAQLLPSNRARAFSESSAPRSRRSRHSPSLPPSSKTAKMSTFQIGRWCVCAARPCSSQDARGPDRTLRSRPHLPRNIHSSASPTTLAATALAKPAQAGLVRPQRRRQGRARQLLKPRSLGRVRAGAKGELVSPTTRRARLGGRKWSMMSKARARRAAQGEESGFGPDQDNLTACPVVRSRCLSSEACAPTPPPRQA